MYTGASATRRGVSVSARAHEREELGLGHIMAVGLALENDERLFPLADNLAIHARTGIPLVFDTFHHSLFNAGESLGEALRGAKE